MHIELLIFITCNVFSIFPLRSDDVFVAMRGHGMDPSGVGGGSRYSSLLSLGELLGVATD